MIKQLSILTAAILLTTTGSILAKEKKNDIFKRDENRKKKIIQTLKYGIKEDRLMAIANIRSISTKVHRDAALKHLVKDLEFELDNQIIRRAISVLSEYKVHEAIPRIASFLGNSSDSVKAAAIYGLKSLKASTYKKKLITMFKEQNLDKDSTINEALLNTLGEFKATEITEYVIKKIKDNTTTKINREYMVLFLGKVGGSKAEDLLISLYQDEDEREALRAYAVNSLGHQKIRRAIPAIKKEIERIESYSIKKRAKYFKIYIYSVAALVHMGDASAYPRLINGARSDNVKIRRKAISLMGELKDKRSIDILKYKMKHDRDKSIRVSAKKTLKDMGVPVDTEKEEKKTP